MRQRILLYEPDNAGQWVAHSLDTNLTGAGPTPLAAFERLAGVADVAGGPEHELAIILR